MPKQVDDPTAFFWKLANRWLEQPGVIRSTMMGFPCLRMRGEFFACADHRTGDLIVKLPAARVGELIATGTGRAFAPAGRTFKEWVLIPDRETRVWHRLIEEARAFVAKL